MSESVELDAAPVEVLDGLTVAVTETGQRYTISTDRLDDEGVLVVEKPDEDDLEVTPADLRDWMFAQGVYYVPEYSLAWEVDEALDQLAGDRDGE